jgi:hypothetical protein
MDDNLGVLYQTRGFVCRITPTLGGQSCQQFSDAQVSLRSSRSDYSRPPRYSIGSRVAPLSDADRLMENLWV